MGVSNKGSLPLSTLKGFLRTSSSKPSGKPEVSRFAQKFGSLRWELHPRPSDFRFAIQVRRNSYYATEALFSRKKLEVSIYNLRFITVNGSPERLWRRNKCSHVKEALYLACQLKDITP